MNTLSSQDTSSQLLESKNQHDIELTRWFMQTKDQAQGESGFAAELEGKNEQETNFQNAWQAADLLVRHLIPAVLKQVQLQNQAQLARRLPAIVDGPSLVPARGPLAMARHSLKERVQELKTGQLQAMDAHLTKALDELVWSEVQTLLGHESWCSSWQQARILSTTPGAWRWENISALTWEVVELSAWVAAVEAVLAGSQTEVDATQEQWSVQQAVYRRLEQLRVAVDQVARLHSGRSGQATSLPDRRKQQQETAVKTRLSRMAKGKSGYRFRSVVFGE